MWVDLINVYGEKKKQNHRHSLLLKDFNFNG